MAELVSRSVLFSLGFVAAVVFATPAAAGPSGRRSDRRPSDASVLEALTNIPLGDRRGIHQALMHSRRSARDIAALMQRAVRRGDEIALFQLSVLASRRPERERERIFSALRGDASSSARTARLGALKAIALLRLPERDVLPIYERALADHDAQIRYRAARGLGRIRHPSGRVIAGLRRLLSDRSESVTYRALASLAETGAAARAAVPDLHVLARTGAGELQAEAERLLVKFGEMPQEAASGPSPLRAAAPEADIGLAWQTELPVLEIVDVPAAPSPEAQPFADIFTNGTPAQRADAAMRVAESGAIGPDTLAALRTGLGDPDERVRFASLFALESIGHPALAELVEAAEARDNAIDVRIRAIQALKRMSSQTDRLTPVFTELMQGADPRVRVEAALALVAFDVPDKAALTVLLRAVAGADTATARTVLAQLGALDADAVVPVLADLASTSDPAAKAGICATLPSLRGSAVAKRQLLHVLLEDSDAHVRALATDAMDSLPKTS